MNVIIYDINPKINTEFQKVDLNSLLSLSDVVSLHIPLNKCNYNFLNEELLFKLKKDAIFINTSRGEIIDETALLNLLKSGHIYGIGLDVLSDEFSTNPQWLESNELRKYSEKGYNILMTPHIGGLTSQSVEKANNFIIDKLENFLNSKKKIFI
jgi:D-3-phosphoglycerate dehydrogenase